MLQDERTAGFAEGRAEERKQIIMEYLDELGKVPSWLRQQILEEKNLDKLLYLSKESRHAKSLEEFIQNCQLKGQKAE